MRLKQLWQDLTALASDKPLWDTFTSHKQQDAAEFLDALAESLRPDIRQVFPVLKLEVTHQCTFCGTEKTIATSDLYRMISAPIPDPPNNHDLKLENLLPFGGYSDIDAKDNVRTVCECDIQTVRQKRRTASPPTDQYPEHLIVRLNRFEWIIEDLTWKK